MSSEKTLALSKIAHLGQDLGLSDDFRSSLVHEYSMYFWVVGSKDPLDVEGPKLELVRWSTRLAVTKVEKKAQEQQKTFRLGWKEPSSSIWSSLRILPLRSSVR